MNNCIIYISFSHYQFMADFGLCLFSFPSPHWIILKQISYIIFTVEDSSCNCKKTAPSLQMIINSSSISSNSYNFDKCSCIRNIIFPVFSNQDSRKDLALHLVNGSQVPLFFHCGKIPITKLIILVIFKCTVY